jgi:hypothetical protein
MKNQFNLRSIFLLTAMVATLCATYSWLLSSMVVIAEVVYRKLNRGQLVAAIISFFITAAWYVAIICIIYAASV